ncbi:hypothetical protein E4U19_004042 [Claviceps sp. Clav32 group G5]|nr:hypothetical protein E4U19_004042 [Claviceps sp. Clav32 group G5]
MGPAVWPSGRLQRPPAAHSQQSQRSQSAQSSHSQHAVGAHDNALSGRRSRVFAAASPPLPSLPASPPPRASTPPSRTTADESCAPRRSDTSASGNPALRAPIAPPTAAKVHPSPAPSNPPEHRRLDGSADVAPSTAPNNEPESSFASARAAQSRVLKASSQQPFYPNLSPASATERAATAVAAEKQEHLEAAALRPHNTNLLTSPFRKTNHKTKIASPRSGRPSASRLWNPTNSTPRTSAQQRQRRKRRPSSPLPPSVPLQHPAFCSLAETDDPYDTAAGSYPLLTLSEQRQSRHAVSGRTTFLVDGSSGSNNRRISLPRPIRTSADAEQILSRHGLAVSNSPLASRSGGLCADAASSPGPSAESKGKQKAIMAITEDTRRSCSRDLERGPDVVNARLSTISAADGIGASSISSSNSSIMGEDVQPGAAEEWGPQHPCYPHLNPHVPPESTEYATTRIIRVKRDWLVAGDLAPTFSNLYPEILDPAGVSEQEFRRVVDKLNAELVPIFNPYGWRNILDAALGLVTGWLWDDFGMTAAKGRMDALEAWMERWNGEMEKTMAEEEGVLAPKLIPLRQTGYMSLDIQIPDPEIAPAPSSVGAGDSRTALPLEPTHATPPET